MQDDLGVGLGLREERLEVMSGWWEFNYGRTAY